MSEAVVSALVGAIVGNVIVAIWAGWPVIVDVWHHGWRNDR